MKLIFDKLLSIVLIVLFVIPILFIIILIKMNSSGPIIYWSDRIGRNSAIFSMPKFRTMEVNTPEVATHLMQDSEKYITSLGKFLRKTSLDELPQLYSVLIGDMSFVGPRPALFNQDDLIKLRKDLNIDQLVPGITGYAQVMGRDSISIDNKVAYDAYYLEHKSFIFDIKIIFLTLANVIISKNISH